MGRGANTRGLLPLLEDYAFLPDCLLKLPFVEGTFLEIICRDSKAFLTVSGSRLLKGQLPTVEMSRASLVILLQELEALCDQPEGALSFGAYEFLWSDDITPSLFLYLYPASLISDGVRLGALASRDVLYRFLQTARSEGLF